MAIPVRNEDILPFRDVPQNVEAEMCVIGSMLLDNATIDDVSTLLIADDFFRDGHQVLFRRIVEIRSTGSAVDALILIEDLKRQNLFTDAGGDQAIQDCLHATPHAANAVYYAQIVKQRSVSRSLLTACDDTIREIRSNDFTADQLAERAENRVYAISDTRSSGCTSDLSEAVDEAFRGLERRRSGEVVGISSGWRDLDDITDGFVPGTLTIIGGRPSMGKTAIALNVCESAALSGLVTPLLVSLEMGRVEVANRLIQSVARVEGYRLKKPWMMNVTDKVNVQSARDRLAAHTFPIDDTPGRTIGQIAANARRLKSRRGIGLIVVDYIQLIDGENAREARHEQISKISRRLKGIARDLNVPVIALSQLNRGVEGREDHRPRMSDLRESGAIEQDADVVILVHRPEYYDENDQPGIAELIVAKNRNGGIGTVKLVFQKHFTRFDGLEPDPV